jgi:hypothetical protein
MIYDKQGIDYSCNELADNDNHSVQIDGVPILRELYTETGLSRGVGVGVGLDMIY